MYTWLDALTENPEAVKRIADIISSAQCSNNSKVASVSVEDATELCGMLFAVWSAGKHGLDRFMKEQHKA